MKTDLLLEKKAEITLKLSECKINCRVSALSLESSKKDKGHFLKILLELHRTGFLLWGLYWQKMAIREQLHQILYRSTRPRPDSAPCYQVNDENFGNTLLQRLFSISADSSCSSTSKQTSTKSN